MRILTIDGGGLKGIYPITIISELEKRKYNFRNTFDLYSGTSIGGVIAIFLALNEDPSFLIAEFYNMALILDIRDIFERFFDWTTDRFKNHYFGEISSKVLLPVYDLSNGELSHFGLNSQTNCDDVPISDIIKAICSDYRIMDCYKIDRISKQYIDAGFFAYNPLMYCMRNLQKKEKHHILSIGCGFIKNISNRLNRDDYFDLIYDAIIYDQLLSNDFIINYLNKNDLLYYRISETVNNNLRVSIDELSKIAALRIEQIDHNKLTKIFG